jgi:hypothetical protein
MKINMNATLMPNSRPEGFVKQRGGPKKQKTSSIEDATDDKT